MSVSRITPVLKFCWYLLTFVMLRIPDRDPKLFWPLDLGFGMGKKSGSGSGMNNPDHVSESLVTIFWVKILKFFVADPGSRINIPDPQRWYTVYLWLTGSTSLVLQKEHIWVLLRIEPGNQTVCLASPISAPAYRYVYFKKLLTTPDKWIWILTWIRIRIQISKSVIRIGILLFCQWLTRCQ